MLKKARQVKLYEDVALQIEEAILRGDYKPGDKLPAERDLEKILGASRGTIRQSLRILQQEGVLEIKTGAHGGAIIKDSSSKLLTSSVYQLVKFKHVTVDQVIQFRKGIEADLIVPLACKQARKKEIKELRTLLDSLKNYSTEKEPDWERYLDLESQMHIFLSRMTKNPLYVALLEMIIQSTEEKFPDMIEEFKNVIDGVIRDWENILKGLEGKSIKKVSNAMSDHVRILKREITEAVINRSGNE